MTSVAYFYFLEDGGSYVFFNIEETSSVKKKKKKKDFRLLQDSTRRVRMYSFDLDVPPLIPSLFIPLPSRPYRSLSSFFTIILLLKGLAY